MASVQTAKRRGGRHARHGVRAKPLPLADRPVWPGTEGGRYLPLSDASVVQKAITSTAEILENHFPAHIDPALDLRIRERFDIKLAAATMRPGSCSPT